MNILNRLLVIFSLCIVSTSVFALTEDEMLQSVFKVKTYEMDKISENYNWVMAGSAVYIGNDQIITNAHVILDSFEKPYGNYEICRVKISGKDPECFSTAKVIAYDAVADLALLKLTKPLQNIKAPKISDKTLKIAESVIAYGYPAIGGMSITRTEGKIGGIEQEQYKFDGTIDHGNSGGGAFDKDGNLVGIPTAVASDNGVIGYIVTAKTVKEFLAGKSDNYEKTSEQIKKTFETYVNQIQSLYKNPNLIKTKYVSIKDMEKNGFKLFSATESYDGTIFDYRFYTKNQNTFIVVSCDKEGETTKKTLDQRVKDYQIWHKENYPEENVANNTDNKDYIHSTYSRKDEKGILSVDSYIFSKKYSNCGVGIITTDKKKYGKDFEKGVAIAKKVVFSGVPPITSGFKSSYFSITSVPETLSISEGTDTGDVRILPRITTILTPEFYVSSRLGTYEYSKVNDLMNIGYEEDRFYRGKDYSWEAFVKRFTGDPVEPEDGKLTLETIKTKNGKRVLFSIYKDAKSDLTYLRLNYFVKNKSKGVMGAGFDFQYYGDNVKFEKIIREFVKNMEIPGDSPFLN